MAAGIALGRGRQREEREGQSFEQGCGAKGHCTLDASLAPGIVVRLSNRATGD
jgi:hypothetical protein